MSSIVQKQINLAYQAGDTVEWVDAIGITQRGTILFIEVERGLVTLRVFDVRTGERLAFVMPRIMELRV